MMKIVLGETMKKGQATVEYILIAGIMAVVFAALYAVLQKSVANLFSKAAQQIVMAYY